MDMEAEEYSGAAAEKQLAKKRVTYRALTLAILVSLGVGVVAGAGGFFLLQSNGSKQIEDASQALLTNVLHKLADVSDEKALKVTDVALSAALRTLGDVFQNASANTNVSLANGDFYLCNLRQKTMQFSSAGYAANYTAICTNFDKLVSSSLPDFEKVFSDLIWSLIDLDNTIQLDP
jgi:hypothetical protein